MIGREMYLADDCDRKEICVPTFVQRYSWDCGLACACMIVRYLGHDSSKVYGEYHKELRCGESVWTIDLSHLLQKYRIRTKLTTTTLGVNQSYGSSAFYKQNFTTDEDRVNKLFQEAESHGIVVEKRSVPLNEIRDHIQQNNLVIALVDWSYLQCIWCDKCGISCINCLKRCSKCCNNYQGHYIIVSGYDKKKGRIFYKNPSYDIDLCCSGEEQFEMARKSYGTDEDTLFVYCGT